MEDQQAKGDPGDDEIEGLDTEVLLNANTLLTIGQNTAMPPNPPTTSQSHI